MASTLVFSVKREQPVLVAPAKPTPHELKPLSDIDDQEGLRFQVPTIHVYRNHSPIRGRDLTFLLREALAKALIFYYPFAGRLREWPGRKLAVECTGEGVLFIEADADVSLEQLSDAIQLPFPCFDELLYDVPGSGGILDCPLMLIQVTHLTCGGFIVGLRFTHAICDYAGILQLMRTIAQIALGAHAPSIPPVWERELLNARRPSRITCYHPEYEDTPQPAGAAAPLPSQPLLHRSFFFTSGHIATLRRRLPPHLRHSTTTFELLTACLWRCKTLATLQPPYKDEAKIIFVVNSRTKYSPPLPDGYYGNVLAFPIVVSPAGDLCRNPIGYAVEQVKKTKAMVTQEYMQSMADLMVIKGKPPLVRTWMVSDLTASVGAKEVDFGWGKAVYSGPPQALVTTNGVVVSFYIPFCNGKGEDGILVPVCMTEHEMERFSKEVDSMINDKEEEAVVG
ncbi:hypothetical protein MRB53_028185 [Persea americana]|uniref:Uncharacterized protein n=1 Tax=Persea americana TaxID=3435 RepID=A0ACC2KF62_PERAE|nr:hypothetical protein MRB53_028185 [Persea americana]